MLPFVVKQGVALTGRNTTGPPPGDYARYGVLHTITDYDRR